MHKRNMLITELNAFSLISPYHLLGMKLNKLDENDVGEQVQGSILSEGLLLDSSENAYLVCWYLLFVLQAGW
jgi:hypothetical protein